MPPYIPAESLTCEYQHSPLGIDVTRPRLGWRLEAPERSVRQTAYQIRAAGSLDDLHGDRDVLWDTGRVESRQSTQRPYTGPPLQSRQRCFWQVRIWDDHGQPTAWSEPAAWEMGLLQPADWQAEFITPASSISSPCPFLRAIFKISGDIQSARAYVSSLGLYELELNGRRVGDWLFTPGWTSYNFRLQYQTYDIASDLQPGLNAIGAILGEGWYRGRVRGAGQPPGYGGPLALLAQLVITSTDGRVQVLGSDTSWASSTGPLLKSDIYDGEDYDARLEQPGWSTAGFDAGAWAPVQPLDRSHFSRLVAQYGPPVRRIETIRPVAILPSPPGQALVDMGQNMVGWVRLRVRGPAGATVTLRHAEVLDQAGRFYTDNLRDAQQTDRYTLKGGGEEVYEPRFTFHGFRYVLVEG
ncbi:MAG: family 78 glycoside hydrolase catalytic domain, partial [Anaerolineales bacterium]